MSEPDTDLPHQVALFRYGLIAELVRLEAIAAQDHVIPGSSRTRVAAETLIAAGASYERLGEIASRVRSLAVVPTLVRRVPPAPGRP